jgi:single-strand DNA-binding protein
MNNRVQLIGRLGMDPEVREFEKGKLARFSVATNDVYKNDKGEYVTSTEWHRVVAWNNMANIAEKILHKGSEAALEGRLINRSYEKEGVKQVYTEVQLTGIQVFGKSERNNEPTAPVGAEKAKARK